MRSLYCLAVLACVLSVAGSGEAQRTSSLRVSARTGCADRLAFEVDPGARRNPDAEQARREVEGAFRRVASALCVSGDLSISTFLAFDRVVLRHAGGAGPTTLRPGAPPRTLIYAPADLYRRPVDEAQLREGLLCLGNPARAGCQPD